MKKARVDLENAIVYIIASKTPKGIGDMPMTAPAQEAFRREIEETPGSQYLFPSPKIDRQQAIHHEPAKGLGSNAEEGGRSIFHASRSCGAALLPG